MKIVPVKDLGNTPAKVSRRTGTIYLNCEIWDKLPKQERKAIFYHEKGHYELNTSNEFEADNYAFERYAGTEKYSLKGLLHALADNLDIKNNSEHKKRYLIITEKLLKFDYEHNHNLKALQKLIEMKAYNINDIFPPTNKALLFQMLVDFLKGKNISSIESVSEEERLTLLTEFFQLPAVLHLIYRTGEINAADSLFGKSKEERDAARQARQDAREERKANQTGAGRQIIGQLTQTFAEPIGAAISAVGLALGVTIPPEVGTSIANMAGKGIKTRGDDIANNRADGTTTDDSTSKDKTTGANVHSPNKKDVVALPEDFHHPPYRPVSGSSGPDKQNAGKAKDDKKIKPWQIATGISGLVVIGLIIYYVTK